MRGDLLNQSLFGNEAGEDEDLDVLNSYFLDKDEFKDFYSPDQRLAFVRSRKGVGKSALLKQTLYRRQKDRAADLHIYVKASDLVALQEINASSPDTLVYGWQQRICSQINLELGARLRVAFSDASMTLVESAELAGFRDRNIVGSLFDRFKAKGGGVEFEKKKFVQADARALLKRISDKKDIAVWVFVDDVDATFLNTAQERTKISTFFSACRNLANAVRGLRLRAAVRTDVWTILAQHDEALDKCEQYMLDLRWSTNETGAILEKKILSYFKRQYPNNSAYTKFRQRQDSSKIRQLVFREPFNWSGRPLEAFRPIHILCAGRPRWAAQLCKLAGKSAYEKHANKIGMGHIQAQLRAYGKSRLDDLYKEHRHQCPRMQDIIECFSGGPARYRTEELLKLITDEVVRKRGVPEIDGIRVAGGSLNMAHFLFRIGFICARDDLSESGLGFIRHEDRPNLLSTTANLDDGMDWEIHPSYREVLRIKRRPQV